jgi:hypothetical protein
LGPRRSSGPTWLLPAPSAGRNGSSAVADGARECTRPAGPSPPTAAVRTPPTERGDVSKIPGSRCIEARRRDAFGELRQHGTAEVGETLSRSGRPRGRWQAEEPRLRLHDHPLGASRQQGPRAEVPDRIRVAVAGEHRPPDLRRVPGRVAGMYCIAARTSYDVRSTCALKRSVKTRPRRPMSRLSPRASRTSSPFIPAASAAKHAASTRRWRGLPWTPRPITRIPKRSRPATNAAQMTSKHRRVRRFQTSGHTLTVTCTGRRPESSGRFSCDGPRSRALFRPAWSRAPPRGE